MRKLLLLFASICIFMCNMLFAQTKEITGKITDSKDGSPIPGATIRIKGGGATTTKADGSFTLKTTKDDVTLEISSIGYAEKSVKAHVGTSLTIQLDVDTKALSEVVITGVGVATSKKKLAISVEAVTSDKLPQGGTASIDQALVGKIAGAQISSISGVPGSQARILLRGINTLQGSTNPMILLDGLQLAATDINSIDLAGIERVEVIQGAAAATIYGAQGANGVIQLFSKKGKAGQLNIDISSSITQNTYLNIGGLGKAKTHAFNTNANNEVIGGNGSPLVYDPATGVLNSNLIWDALNPNNQTNKAYDKNLKYYDHFNQFFVPANVYNNSVTISGGKEKLDFSISASNNRQESNFRKMGYNDRSNFISNIGFEVAKNLKFRSTTQLVYTKNTINGNQGLVYPIFNSRPFADYDFLTPDGHHTVFIGNAAGVNGNNPNYTNEYSGTVDNKVDVVQSLNLNYKLNRFVELDAKYGLNYRTEDYTKKVLNQSEDVSAIATDHYVSFNNPDNTGEISDYRYKTIFQNFITTATIRFDFEKDFHIKIPIIATTQGAFDYRNNKYKAFGSYGLGVPTYSPFTASQATTYKIFQDYTEPFITYGYVATQRFDYGDIAGISGGIRSDYSSAFGQGSKPFTFPRGDAYVRLSAMNFWSDGKLGKVVSEFKLRAAYGEAGIQPGPFQRYVTLSTKTYGNSNAFYVSASQPNPNLNVEVSKELEVGTDITFKAGKGSWIKNINFSLTYWDRRTDNAIWNLDAAPSTGTGNIVDNVFGLKSHGIQASINANIYSSKNFGWSFTTNYSKQVSIISSVKGPEVVIISSAGSTNYVLRAGEKVGQIYGFLGLHSVDQVDASGNPYIDKAEQGNYTLASNGWVVNKTTKQPYFTPNQYTFGDPNPKFNMSFINEFSYKDFLTVSVQLDWIHGAHIYNQTKEWMYRDGINSDYEKPITIDGQTGAWTAFYRGVYAQVSRNGTKNYFYENGSFARLRNLSVALDVAKIVNIKPFRKLQVVLSGRNLFTITKYTGMDPENSSGGTNSPWDRGTDHSTLPNFKSYQAGINIGF
ncbi:MAG: SusC/RagA family TonB-linked outer membrane protein [Chitinophagaceae bacterium]